MGAHEKLVLALVTWNVITFITMGIDKRKAIKGKPRISESTLFLLAFAMGGLGLIVSIPVFHHKTKKPFFIIGAVLILLINILTLMGILKMIAIS